MTARLVKPCKTAHGKRVHTHKKQRLKKGEEEHEGGKERQEV